MRRVSAVGVVLAVTVASTVFGPSRTATARTHLETLTIPFDVEQYQITETIFDPDKTYEFEISGTQRWSLVPEEWQSYDAFYMFECVNSSPNYCPDLPSQYEPLIVYEYASQAWQELSVMLNRDVYPPFNASHSYTLTTKGLNGALPFGLRFAGHSGSFTIDIYESGCAAPSASRGDEDCKAYDWIVKFNLVQKGLQTSPDPANDLVRTITKGRGRIRFDKEPSVYSTSGQLEKTCFKQADYRFVTEGEKRPSKVKRVFCQSAATSVAWDSRGYVDLLGIPVATRKDDPCPISFGNMTLGGAPSTDAYVDFNGFPDPPGCQINRRFVNGYTEDEVVVSISPPIRVKEGKNEA